MNGSKQAHAGAYALLVIAAIALFALVLALGAPRAGAAGYPSGSTGLGAPAHETETEQATETARPCETGTPHAGLGHEPCETRTAEPSETARPCETGTPHAGLGHEPCETRTPEATETEHPRETQTPHATETEHPRETETPHATETEHPRETQTPHATETEHPRETETPRATETRHAEASHTPEATHTPRPVPTRVLSLDPRIQFAEVQPGETDHYDFTLRNRSNNTEEVTLAAMSRLGWSVAVTPTAATLAAGAELRVVLAVGVPDPPNGELDTISVVATDGTNTASAFVVLLTREHGFSDLSAQDWAWNPVQFLASQSVISGYADGSFRPNNTVTRAQFAKMLVNGLGWPLLSPAQATFSDVPTTYWAFAYVETAVQHGALAGYADGSFRPNADITRAQLAKLIVTSRGWALVQPGNPTFSDVPGNYWAAGFVETAVDAQILSGYSDGTFRPNAPATRAQVAKILANGLLLSQDR